jgi:Leucine-rich repeat (LRR) protein
MLFIKNINQEQNQEQNNITEISIQNREILYEKIIKICSYINLKKISLNYCNITKIPKQIKNLINLEYLDLSINHIKKIPDELMELINLKVLYLHLNKITIFPNKLANLINLQKLYLYYNNTPYVQNIFIYNDKCMILNYYNYLELPNNIKYLNIINGKYANFNNLPNTLEYLQIGSLDFPVFLNISPQLNNLPINLKLLILHNTHITRENIKLPYGCKLIIIKN